MSQYTPHEPRVKFKVLDCYNLFLFLFCIRAILNVLYTIVETMRVPGEEETESDREARETFKSDLSKNCII